MGADGGEGEADGTVALGGGQFFAGEVVAVAAARVVGGRASQVSPQVSAPSGGPFLAVRQADDEAGNDDQRRLVTDGARVGADVSRFRALRLQRNVVTVREEPVVRAAEVERAGGEEELDPAVVARLQQLVSEGERRSPGNPRVP